MRLAEYLERDGVSQAEFARRLGVSRSAVGQWIHGHTIPSGRTAVAIVRVTDGLVRFEDIFADHAHAPWVPFGSILRDGQLYRDPDSWFLCSQVVDLHEQGMSWAQIAGRLERLGKCAPDGGPHWSAATIRALYENHDELMGLPFPDEGA